jgi:putative oxidoreductase
VVAAVTGVAAGTLLALGLATPLAVAAFVGVMVNTIVSAHLGNGPWYFNDGWEYNLTLLTAAAALGFTGAGELSLDELAGLDLAGWSWGLGATALGLVTGTAALRLRHRGTRPEPGTVPSEPGVAA